MRNTCKLMLLFVRVVVINHVILLGTKDIQTNSLYFNMNKYKINIQLLVLCL